MSADDVARAQIHCALAMLAHGERNATTVAIDESEDDDYRRYCLGIAQGYNAAFDDVRLLLLGGLYGERPPDDGDTYRDGLVADHISDAARELIRLAREAMR